MKRDMLLVFVLALVIFIAGIWGGSLSSWDEAFYAQVSREMFASGNFVDLTWGGNPWSDKPPVYMWVTAFFYGVFGVNEFAVRLFSALCGAMTVAVTYLFAARVFDRRTGIVSALMLSSVLHFLIMAKQGNLDTAFTFMAWTGASLFALSGKRSRLFLLSFVFMALAFLTKGPAAFIALLALAVYACIDREAVARKRPLIIAGLILSAAIAGAWYIPAFLHYGEIFIKGQIGEHLLSRTASAMDGHTGTWLTYINVILYKGKIWGGVGLVLLPVLAFMIYRGSVPRKAALPVVWSAVFILAFTCIRTKLHWYIIPVYPALCVIAAWGAVRFTGRYSVFVIAAASAASIFYFGAVKGVFYQDNNPSAKAFSNEVLGVVTDGEELYVYGVSDPGLRFYLGAGKAVDNEKELKDLSGKKGAVLVTPIGDAGRAGGRIRLSDPAIGYAVSSVEL